MAITKRTTTKRAPTKRNSRIGGKTSDLEAHALTLTESEKFEDVNNLEYTTECMVKYGKQTLENRAVPDFRDGLIPVQRRVLYAMYKLNIPKDKVVKAARVVGEVIGKYHPHGDTAVYGSMVTMSQAPIQFVKGSGNWGSYDDPKSYAAMRYTECALSAVAHKVFFTGYLTKIHDLIANFDNNEVEPTVLHCNIPVALALGKLSGIAVGLACNIPSFTLESVIELTRMAFQGKKITPKLCMDTLVFNFAWGGVIHPRHLTDGSLLEVVKTGSGKLCFVARHEYDAKAGELIIKDLPPSLNYETAVTKTINGGFKISDGTTVDSEGLDIRIDLRGSAFSKKTTAGYAVNKDVMEKVLNLWTGGSIPIRFAITDRQLTEEAVNAGSALLDIEVVPSIGIPAFIDRWVKYRLNTEIQMAKVEKLDVQESVDRLDLVILARENFDLVKKALDNEDPIGEFPKALYKKSKIRITEEDSKYIFSLTLIRLSKVDVESTQNKIKDLKARIKACDARIKNPAPTAIEALDSILA